MTETKEDRDFARRLENCQSQAIGKYNNKTAAIFQKMIRAEAAVIEGNVPAVVLGKIVQVYSPKYKCVCVTCGQVFNWKATGKSAGTLDTGHFLAGRHITYLFEESGVHPQCAYDNQHNSGASDHYETYMLHVYGQDEIDRLRAIKADSTEHWWYKAGRLERQEWSVRKRIEFQQRLKATGL